MNKEEIWFHGTLTEGIEEFRAFTHFGSRKAAAEVVARNFYLGKVGVPLLLKAVFSFGKDSKIEMNDWGAPNSIATALSLKRHFSGELAVDFERIRRELISIKQSGSQEYDEIGFRELSDLLLDQGVEAIVYPNRVEGDYGEPALCLIDKSVVLNIEVDEFSEAELEIAKGKVEDKYLVT